MEGDVVTALVASVATVVAGAQLQVLAAAALGDRVARRRGVLWDLWGRVDRTGTLIVPGLLALATGGAIGWAARPPLRVDELPVPRQVLVGLVPAVVALVVAAGSLLLVGAGGGPSDGLTGPPGTAGTVAVVALLQAALWAIPAPPLPAGLVVGAVLRGDRADGWARLARGSRAPYGLGAGVLLVITDAPAVLRTALLG